MFTKASIHAGRRLALGAGWVALLAAPALILAPTPLPAQPPNHARGFEPRNTFELGDLEHVNLFNGNLTLTIPIGPAFPVGPELSYQLLLTYTGNVWEWEEICPDYPVTSTCYLQALPRLRSTAGLGWELGFGRMLQPDDVASPSALPAYAGADQSSHALHAAMLHPGQQ
ncbi:MAG: hypothetical protein PVG07_16600, partial [Acidobacteriota bacterium]